jgi:hypothetical protein
MKSTPSRLVNAVRRRLLTTSRLITEDRRCLPDYVVIGVQRGGTTSLHNYLSAHPQILTGFPKKELHFFDLNYGRGQGFYRMSFPTREEKRRLEERWNRRILMGESSPYYIFHPAVPKRMSLLVPRVRVIVLLRNPVDRAISHYFHSARKGYETLEMEEAFAREEERLDGEAERLMSDDRYVSFAHRHLSYLSRGRYAEQLARWFEYFDREQVLVLQSERLFDQTEDILARVFEFLGCEPHPLPISNVYNWQQYGAVNASAIEWLQDHYRPLNAQLNELVGFDFQWGV